MEGLDDDINIIKSLIAISKGGLLVSNIEREYRNMTEERLSFRKYGFSSIVEMLSSSKDIVIKPSPNGPACHVIDAKMSHVTSLVERQRTAKKNTKSKKRPFSQRGRFFPASSRNCSSPIGYRQPQYWPKHSATSSQFRRPSQPLNRFQPHQAPCSRVSTQTLQDRNKSATLQPHNVNENFSRKQALGLKHCSGPQHQPDARHFNNLSAPPFEQNPLKLHYVNENFSRKQALGAKHCTGPQHQPNARHFSNFSAVASQESSMKNQTYCSVSGSNLKQSNQKSSEPTSKAECQRCESDSDWSDSPESKSSSGWSTDSQLSFECDKPGMTGVACKQKSGAPRTVEFLPSNSVNGLNCSSKQGITNSTSTLTITVPRNLNNNNYSDSDWSDDEDLNVSLPHRDNPASATMPMLTPSSMPHVLKIAPLHSITNSKSLQENEQGRPLMVGGIGRGKFLNRVKSGERIVVSTTPIKREAVATVNEGLSNIMVTFKNSLSIKQENLPAFSYQDFHLIGDMYLLRIAQLCLGPNVDFEGSCSQLCRAKLSISECREEIIKCGTAAKIVLMIGMTDILKGASFEDMKLNMSSLLQRLKNKRLILVTLPVPPSFIHPSNEMKLSVIENYNRWLLTLGLACIIDINEHLYCNSDFFQKSQESTVETFSDEGSRVVKDAIDSAIC